jgi:hypothetical protein
VIAAFAASLVRAPSARTQDRDVGNRVVARRLTDARDPQHAPMLMATRQTASSKLQFRAMASAEP